MYEVQIVEKDKLHISCYYFIKNTVRAAYK